MPDETSALLGENANSTSYGNVVRDVEEDLQQHKPQVSLPMIVREISDIERMRIDERKAASDGHRNISGRNGSNYRHIV